MRVHSNPSQGVRGRAEWVRCQSGGFPFRCERNRIVLTPKLPSKLGHQGYPFPLFKKSLPSVHPPPRPPSAATSTAPSQSPPRRRRGAADPYCAPHHVANTAPPPPTRCRWHNGVLHCHRHIYATLPPLSTSSVHQGRSAPARRLWHAAEVTCRNCCGSCQSCFGVEQHHSTNAAGLPLKPGPAWPCGRRRSRWRGAHPCGKGVQPARSLFPAHWQILILVKPCFLES